MKPFIQAPSTFFDEPSEPNTIRDEARAQALEVITRFLIWIAEGGTTVQRGMRATVALYCVRPDLIGGCTLEQIGIRHGCTEQAAYKLARDFRHSMGLTQ